MSRRQLRNLVVIFGDQLDTGSAALENLETEKDAVWMAEVSSESEYAWSTKARITLFLSAMRHFRTELEERGIEVLYRELSQDSADASLDDALKQTLETVEPERIVCVEPGEYRIREWLESFADSQHIELEMRTDSHFFTTIDDFREHAEGRKSLRLEYFYRELRKRFDILMVDDKPAGGEWNFDKDNRESFGKDGPSEVPEPPRFKPDAITRSVIDLVHKRFGDHPGSLQHFAWPVTREQALEALDAFVQDRLPLFGDVQDAMWTGEWHLYHSLLSSSLNLKLLNPREVVEAACKAYEDGTAPINAVEGFVRQILGWREYVRGIYWTHMPDYLERNELEADQPLPDFYWTGDTELKCLQESIGQTLEHGYAHHIQRLMVTGLYALLLGVEPKQVHGWYLGVYVDAVEWVELPNTLGMSQYGDGGLMASKPYAATGKYIKRMSNYCRHCPKNPDEAIGNNACPFTTLYWDFLMRNEERLSGNQRMALQLKNIERLSDERKDAIQARADQIRKDPAMAQLK